MGCETLERQMKAEERLKECMTASHPQSERVLKQFCRLLDRKDRYREPKLIYVDLQPWTGTAESVEMDAEPHLCRAVPYNFCMDV